MSIIELDGSSLSIEDVCQVARKGAKVTISQDALKAIKLSHESLQDLTRADAPLYGVNTGFGVFSTVKLEQGEVQQLSKNIIMSHACATGPALDDDTVRAAMLIRANSFAIGHSGVSVTLVQTLVDMLNLEVTPVVPSYGSLAASGDLCLLSHAALCFCETDIEASVADRYVLAKYKGETMPAREALRRAGIAPVRLGAKEGLAITNGATFTAGLLALCLSDMMALWKASNISLALSMEALAGVTAAYDERIHQARGVDGSVLHAKHLRMLLSGSTYATPKSRLQDSYTLRCAPQVQGPVYDNIMRAWAVVERELNAATDNPLIFGRELLSGGNFHGEVLGLQSDSLKVNVCSLANICERRCAKLVTPSTSNGLSAMLTPPLHAGLNSGLMIPPYTAASLALRCHTLASPDTIRSLPTSANQEDYNSNAWNSALFLRDIIKCAYGVVAIEAYMATRGIVQRFAMGAAEGTGGTLGAGSAVFYEAIMQMAPYSETDSFMQPSIEQVEAYLAGDSCQEAYDKLTTEQKTRLNLQTPSGTRDYHPWQMRLRENLINKIKGVFKNHGGQEIDTPVFERRETLMGQYGDNEKLIYELLDQGGVQLALRYDLTVPFARYVAANQVTSMKRFHVAKVYRRDNPSIVTGRYREFYQCDLDICGKSGPMVADAEILHTVWDVLTQIDVTKFIVKLNHRQLLTEILQYSGVAEEFHATVCSSVDKLDKQSWESVREEILLKGVSEESADYIGKYMTVHGPLKETLETLRRQLLSAEEQATDGQPQQKKKRDCTKIFQLLDEMGTLSGYLTAMGINEAFEFDLSLARGLSYYTGIIFEAVAIREAAADGTPVARIGSIAAGGRYDNLIGMFCDRQVPAVGCSFGIERLFTLEEARQTESSRSRRGAQVDVLVHGINRTCTAEVMAITAELWSLGTVSVQFRHAERLNMKDQIEYCLDNAVKYMIVVGPEEIAGGVVNLKSIASNVQTVVPRSELKDHVRQLCAA